MFAQNNSQFLADTVYFTQNLRLIGHKQEWMLIVSYLVR
jgi:hypothetical protein